MNTYWKVYGRAIVLVTFVDTSWYTQDNDTETLVCVVDEQSTANETVLNSVSNAWQMVVPTARIVKMMRALSFATESELFELARMQDSQLMTLENGTLLIRQSKREGSIHTVHGIAQDALKERARRAARQAEVDELLRQNDQAKGRMN